MEILIKPIMNPDTVLLSPYYKQPDASDIPDGFFLDLMPKKKFKQKYPDARVTDFGDQDLNDSTITDWIKDKYLQIGEYWKVADRRSATLLLVARKRPVVIEIWGDEVEKAAKGRRASGAQDVSQARTPSRNPRSLAVHDQRPRDPRQGALGRLAHPDHFLLRPGALDDRRRQAQARVALDGAFRPRSADAASTTWPRASARKPGRFRKFPFVGAERPVRIRQGSLGGSHESPARLSAVRHRARSGGQVSCPRPHAQLGRRIFRSGKSPKTRPAARFRRPWASRPCPTPRNAAIRNPASLSKRSTTWSRSAAFTSSTATRPLPAQHGLADQRADHARSSTPSARCRSRKPDGKRSTMQLVGNTSHPLDEDGSVRSARLSEGHLHTGKGEFDVTLSTGPSSNRNARSRTNFVDSPDRKSRRPCRSRERPPRKCWRSAIRMRPTLGPVGQQIADVFDPPPPDPNMPPQAQAAIQQLQASCSRLMQENSALHMDRAGKVLEQQTKLMHAADEGRRRQPAGAIGERHQSAAGGNHREVARRAAAAADVSRILDRKSRRGARSRHAGDGAPARRAAGAAAGYFSGAAVASTQGSQAGKRRSLDRPQSPDSDAADQFESAA